MMTALTPSKLSVITTAFNEEVGLHHFVDRVSSVCRELVTSGIISDYEIVIVDDGSFDKTWDSIRQAHEKNKCVHGIRFTRNFGHHAAIMAALDHATGAHIIYMDSDLQAQPEEIPRLLQKFQAGYDVVWGVAAHRQDSWVATIGSRVFRWLFKRFSKFDLPRNAVMGGCSRRAAESIKQLREFNRFSLAIWSYVGFKTAQVIVEKKKRLAGNSKYSILQRVKLAVASIVGFSIFPLKIASILGFVMASVGILLGTYVIYRKIVLGIALAGYASLFAAITFFAGLQFLILGILGEYIGIIMSEVKGRPAYLVEQILE